MKKLYAGVTAATAFCLALALTACDNKNPTEPNNKTPEKLKDGEAISLTVGGTENIDLAEYISVPSTDYTYVVSSDNKGIVTVTLEQSTVTVSAVSKGTATVTASVGDISITFAATVNAVPPTFDKATVSYDLYTEASKQITLAPKTGESTYSYTYALKTPDEKITITGDKLTAAYTAATEKTVTVVATYTDTAVTGDPRTVEFDVDITVTDTAPAAPTFDKATVSYDLYTEASKQITLAPKTGESSYSYSYALKTPDENITITDDKLTVAYVAATNKTVTVVATYTDTANPTARPRTVEFDVDITVTDTAPAAPTFDKATVSYDLYTEASKQITLAPKTGESTYSYTYALKTPDEKIAIVGDKLTVSYTAVTEKTVTVVATYTDTANPTARPRTVEFDVDINVTDTAPSVKVATVEKNIDLFDFVNDEYVKYNKEDESISFNLAANVNNSHQDITLAYKAEMKTDEDTYQDISESLTDGKLISDASFPAEAETIELRITVTYGDGENDKFTYTFKVSVKDTRPCRVANGDFSDETALAGWTKEGEIGEISENATYWEDVPVFNVGKYFRGDGKEAATGTLTSSDFTVGGANFITFMLGAAKNEKCYITLEEKDDGGNSYTVKEIWRNTGFADAPAGTPAEEIKDLAGKTVFALNLVTYKADLSNYHGKTVRIVLHDEATGDFGFFMFDELKTYYETSDELPSGAVLAVNELADKSDLQTAIDNAISEKGDYTQDSFDAYTEKLEKAINVNNWIASKQSAVDGALEELNTAFDALVLRVPTEVANAQKSFKIFAGDQTEINLSDYVDEDGLSNISYEVASADTAKLTAVYDETTGKVALSVPGDVTGSNPVEVTIKVKHNGEEKLIVTLTVTATNEVAATLKNVDGVTENIDLFDSSVTDKTQKTIDFSTNIDNPRNIALTYSVTKNGEAITLDGTSYTLAYESYTETPTVYTFAVTVSFTVDSEEKSISYNYVLNVKDTRAYRITNGGFDNDLDGWNLSEGTLGGISTATQYWENETTIPQFYNDGKFFSAYTEGASEGATGTLTSSKFTIGGNGWMTYKLGGAKNIEQVYMEVVRESDGKAVKLPNYNWSDYVGSTKRGCSLIAYKVNLIDFCGFALGDEVRIRITDNATGDYGLFFLDSVVTYYTEVPSDDFYLVSKYKLYNGGFETGNITGWSVGEGSGEFFNITNANEYFGGSYEKVGTWLLSGVEDKKNDGSGENAGNGKEGGTGTLESSRFILKKNATISFKFGGGCNNDQIYIEVVKADGTVLAKFFNTSPADGKLIGYTYTFNMETDEECYIRITDNATSNWGCFSLDAIDTDCGTALDEYITAVNQLD